MHDRKPSPAHGIGTAVKVAVPFWAAVIIGAVLLLH